MKIAVIGSRAFRDWAHFSRVMRDAIKRGDIIISGAARAADAMAKRWADENDIEIIEYPADWSKGLDAGFVRNRQIIGECDQCIAFWDRKSKGTERPEFSRREAVGWNVVLGAGLPAPSF